MLIYNDFVKSSLVLKIQRIRVMISVTNILSTNGWFTAKKNFHKNVKVEKASIYIKKDDVWISEIG